jgi:hypothetical protein
MIDKNCSRVLSMSLFLRREDRRVEEEALEVLEAASKLRPGSGLPQHSATLQDTLEVELDEVVEIKMRQVGCSSLRN